MKFILDVVSYGVLFYVIVIRIKFGGEELNLLQSFVLSLGLDDWSRIIALYIFDQDPCISMLVLECIKARVYRGVVYK